MLFDSIEKVAARVNHYALEQDKHSVFASLQY